jgi:hypothetical protein
MGEIMVMMFDPKAWMAIEDDADGDNVAALFSRGDRMPALLLFAVDRAYYTARGLDSRCTHNEAHVLAPLFDRLYPLPGAATAADASASRANGASKRPADGADEAGHGAGVPRPKRLPTAADHVADLGSDDLVKPPTAAETAALADFSPDDMESDGDDDVKKPSAMAASRMAVDGSVDDDDE